MSAKKKTPNRKRKAKNLTLSDIAITKGEALAEARGIKFTQFIEQLIRQELRSAGVIPPEKK